MRYTVRHIKTHKYLYMSDEAGFFFTDDDKYGIITYRTREFAENFLKELGTDPFYVEDRDFGEEVTESDFEVVEV
jgi:hypothetical protein